MRTKTTPANKKFHFISMEDAQAQARRKARATAIAQVIREELANGKGYTVRPIGEKPTHPSRQVGFYACPQAVEIRQASTPSSRTQKMALECVGL